MRRTLALFAPLVLLWAIAAQMNHAISAWRVYLFLGALHVAYIALFHAQRPGALAVFLGGLLCDSSTPVPFGTHAFLFLVAHTVVFRVRERIPREDTAACVTTALLLNLALFLVFSFTQVHRAPSPTALWPRLFCDLIASQIFLTLIAPWFFALQSRTLELARVPRDLHH